MVVVCIEDVLGLEDVTPYCDAECEIMILTDDEEVSVAGK